MKPALECIPCLLRQTLEAARAASPDPIVHERLMREVLSSLVEGDLRQSPPLVAQGFQRRLRELTGLADPYVEAKGRQNRLAISLLPALEAQVAAAADPFDLAVKLAIAGNIIDLGPNGELTGTDVRRSVEQALREPVDGPLAEFRSAVERAERILYLADNAGELAFDRLLVGRLDPKRVTVVVRGRPVLNDATMEDARFVGMLDLVEVIDNGSDAPGTVLPDTSPAFRVRFAESDLVIAKGQGNYETLCDEAAAVWFLFKVKCGVVARQIHRPIGAQVIVRSGPTDQVVTQHPGATVTR
jgi:uncharacterized protein with ATP-grasp and redox domains